MTRSVKTLHRRRPLTGRLIDDGARVIEAGYEPMRFAAASGLAGLSLRPTEADLTAYWNGDTADYMAELYCVRTSRCLRGSTCRQRRGGTRRAARSAVGRPG